MVYVYRVRRLVKIVVDETAHSTDPLNESGGNPSLQYCLSLFQQLNEDYTAQLARKTLAIATGEKNYLAIDNQKHRTSTYEPSQRLMANSEGLILLTPTGFLNALGEAMAKISPLVSIIVSVLALIVSIFAALHKH